MVSNLHEAETSVEANITKLDRVNNETEQKVLEQTSRAEEQVESTVVTTHKTHH